MLGTTFAPWPSFTDEESEAVQQVLQLNRANYWTGEEGCNFETELASHFRTDHAIGLADGTLALELALNGLGVCAIDGKMTLRTLIASFSTIANNYIRYIDVGPKVMREFDLFQRS